MVWLFFCVYYFVRRDTIIYRTGKGSYRDCATLASASRHIDNRFCFNLCLYIANNKYTAGVLVCAFFLGFIVLIIFNYSDTTTCTCDPILNKYVYFEDYYLKNVYSCEGPNYEQDDNSDFYVKNLTECGSICWNNCTWTNGSLY